MASWLVNAGITCQVPWKMRSCSSHPTIARRTEAGQAANVAAALPDLPGVSQTASLAGPYDVIARARARAIDELAELVTSQVQALDGVNRTMSCPVVHL